MANRFAFGRSLLIKSVAVTGITCLGSFVNFLCQAAIAYRYGVSLAVDSYSYALSLPLFLAGLISIIISYTLVPRLSAAQGDISEGEVGRRASSWIILIACIFVLLGSFAFFWQPIVLPPASNIGRFSGLSMLIVLAWMIGACQILLALCVADLNASGSPVIGALLSIPANAINFLIIVFINSERIETVMAGALIGTIVALGIGVFATYSRLFPPIFITPKSVSKTGDVIGSAGLSAIALSCFASYAVIDTFWTSWLAVGSLAALGFAHRIVIGFGGLIVSGPSALFVPRLAKDFAQGDFAAFKRLFLSACLVTGLVGAVFAGLLYAEAHFIVGLLLGRGEIDSAAVAQIAGILQAMSPGVVFMLCSVISLRAIFCLPGTMFSAAVIGGGYSFVYASLSRMLLDLGVSGIGYAYSLSWAIAFFVQVYFLFFKLRELDCGRDLKP